MSPSTAFANIPIQVIDTPKPDGLTIAKAILHELHGMLETLVATGQGNVIDLRTLPPLGQEGYAFLLETLGCGEVTAQISGFGYSTIQETFYPGVWRIIHGNQDEDILTELIEVCFVPEILKSQPADIAMGNNKLAKLLEELSHNHGVA